jgi:hypothetical protein
MPAQPIHDPGALGDQVASVIADQPDVHRPLVQIRNWELLHPIFDDRAGNRQRVDLIGLARLALALARSDHPLRRDADDPLARRQQRLLQPARNRPAVLDRPHSLFIQRARPANCGQMARHLSLDLAAAAYPTGALVHRRHSMRVLVRVRPDHDHLHRPFVRLNNDEADRRRTALTQGKVPRSYQVTPVVLGRRRATGRLFVSQVDDREVESQPVASPRTNRTGRTSPPRHPPI